MLRLEPLTKPFVTCLADGEGWPSNFIRQRWGRRSRRCFRLIRSPVGAKEALIDILFALYTATPWECLPFELAGCSGMTRRRRLRAWRDAGSGQDPSPDARAPQFGRGDRLVARVGGFVVSRG
jgi:hypothetical protein